MDEGLHILRGLLQRAYEIETGFENEAVFQAFIGDLSDEQRKVLFKLMADSEKHKIRLEKLAKELGFELERKKSEFEFKDKRFFNEIYKLEISARDLYESIALNFKAILGEKAAILHEIAKEEEIHAMLVEKFIDRTLRIL